jgi:hypothetical protein
MMSDDWENAHGFNPIDPSDNVSGISGAVEESNPDADVTIIIADDDGDGLLGQDETFEIEIGVSEQTNPDENVATISVDNITDAQISTSEPPPTVEANDESTMTPEEIDAAVEASGNHGKAESIDVLELDSSQLSNCLGTVDYDLLFEVETVLNNTEPLCQAKLKPKAILLFCDGEYDLTTGTCTGPLVSVENRCGNSCTADEPISDPTIDDICYRPISREPDMVEVRNIPHATAVISIVLHDADGDGYSLSTGDCDDTDNTVFLGAPELCDGRDNDCDEIIAEDAPPPVQIVFPENGALQDGVTFEAETSHLCDVDQVYLYLREADGGDGNPIGHEDLVATYNESSGLWEYAFDTTMVQDGYYVLLAKAIATNGVEGWSEPAAFSIRNWAVLELLPSTESNKAGRTMPVKFALRVVAAVDPDMPFVYNEGLAIRIFDSSDLENVFQTSTYGDSSTDYRIDREGEKYVTNFKTSKTVAEYTVEIWRPSNSFEVGEFTFMTTK